MTLAMKAGESIIRTYKLYKHCVQAKMFTQSELWQKMAREIKTQIKSCLLYKPHHIYNFLQAIDVQGFYQIDKQEIRTLKRLASHLINNQKD